MRRVETVDVTSQSGDLTQDDIAANERASRSKCAHRRQSSEEQSRAEVGPFCACCYLCIELVDLLLVLLHLAVLEGLPLGHLLLEAAHFGLQGAGASDLQG